MWKALDGGPVYNLVVGAGFDWFTFTLQTLGPLILSFARDVWNHSTSKTNVF